MEERKELEKKKLLENVDYVVAGSDKPHIPLLDPRAHALTGKTKTNCVFSVKPIER